LNRRGRFFLLALAAPLGVAGCLTSTQATRLQTDLEEVKKRLFEVQQTAAGNRSRLDEIATRVTGEAPGGPPGQNDMRATLQAVLDQNRALSEQMEDIKARLAALSHDVQGMQGRAASSPPAPSRPSFGGPSSGGTAAGGPAPSPPAGQAATDPAFASAYADYTKGNYELALMGFSDFLKARPDSALASDAQYWIGECLYSQGKFKEAVDAFDQVPSRYPGAQRVPAALLKKGLSQIQTGQTTQGVSTLQKLIETQPQSEEARLASERLQQMGLRSR
jgi:tol-pal system protein YbgF